MTIKHIEAQKEVCCKSGRNYRMGLSDFEELQGHIIGSLPTFAAPEPDYSACLPEGWELRFQPFSLPLWYVFNDEGTHNGGFDSPQAAIAGTMGKYRKMWKEEMKI